MYYYYCCCTGPPSVVASSIVPTRGKEMFMLKLLRSEKNKNNLQMIYSLCDFNLNFP